MSSTDDNGYQRDVTPEEAAKWTIRSISTARCMKPLEN